MSVVAAFLLLLQDADAFCTGCVDVLALVERCLQLKLFDKWYIKFSLFIIT